MKNFKLFPVICGFCAVLLLLLASSPLITLAFYSIPATTAKADLDQIDKPGDVNLKQPNAQYLDENNVVPSPSDNVPVFDSLTLKERQTQKLPTKLPTLPPYYGTKVVYLTFDDGPDPDNTPNVLRILQENDIKATFFVLGTQVEKRPDLLRSLYQEGHAIGNHSYNHIYRELYKSPATYTSQLQKTDEIIKSAIGVRPRITRAPGGSAGSFNKAYWDTLKNEGYIEVGWNVSSGDASSAKASQIVDNIVYQMDNKFLWSHAVVLMHDGRGHEETVKALPSIIKFFKDQGFEFRVINLTVPPPW